MIPTTDNKLERIEQDLKALITLVDKAVNCQPRSDAVGASISSARARNDSNLALLKACGEEVRSLHSDHKFDNVPSAEKSVEPEKAASTKASGWMSVVSQNDNANLFSESSAPAF